MNKFYRKPKPETMRKNREAYAETYKDEIKWFKENVQTLQQTKNKFMIDMYTVLITGSRKVTPKMATAIINGIDKCKSNPHFNEDVREAQEAKLKPILEKISMVEKLAEQKNDKALGFIQNVKSYVKNNYRVTKKQMDALNKVYKRCSEDLFKGDENEG
jgi:esterase/lipase